MGSSLCLGQEGWLWLLSTAELGEKEIIVRSIANTVEEDNSPYCRGSNLLFFKLLFD